MRGLQCLLQLLTKLARGSVHHCFILVLGSAPKHRELHQAARAAHAVGWRRRRWRRAAVGAAETQRVPLRGIERSHLRRVQVESDARATPHHEIEAPARACGDS